MRQKSNHPKDSAEKAVKDIRRQARRRYSPEERSGPPSKNQVKFSAIFWRNVHPQKLFISVDFFH